MVDGRWSMVDGRWSMVDGHRMVSSPLGTEPVPEKLAPEVVDPFMINLGVVGTFAAPVRVRGAPSPLESQNVR
jgi:hypothetical protein